MFVTMPNARSMPGKRPSMTNPAATPLAPYSSDILRIGHHLAVLYSRCQNASALAVRKNPSPASRPTLMSFERLLISPSARTAVAVPTSAVSSQPKSPWIASVTTSASVHASPSAKRGLYATVTTSAAVVRRNVEKASGQFAWAASFDPPRTTRHNRPRMRLRPVERATFG